MKKHTLPKAGYTLLTLLLVFTLFFGTVTAFSEGLSHVYNAEDLFTERDLIQEADLSKAKTITVSSGQDFRIDSEGIYVLSGTASESTVYVEAGPKDKVQLVLDGVTVTNESFPCIYVLSADKVFITSSADSALSVTGTFRQDGDTKTDGVIFSKQDLVLNGTAALTVFSSANGIVCKDDIKITGGTYNVQADKKAFEANDSIMIADGTFTLSAGTDGFHVNNRSNDISSGLIWIGGGTFTITAGDEGIHTESVLQIVGGSFSIESKEGMSAPVVRINVSQK